MKITEIQKIRDDVRQRLLRASAHALPNNPSERGMKADDIRKHFYQSILNASDSLLSEQNRMADETNQNLLLIAKLLTALEALCGITENENGEPVSDALLTEAGTLVGAVNEWVTKCKDVIVQTTGNEEKKVMSQKAVTDRISNINSRINTAYTNIGRQKQTHDADILKIMGGMIGKDVEVTYYTQLVYALNDIVNKQVPKQGHTNPSSYDVCAVYYGDESGRYEIILLDDVTVPQVKFTFDSPITIHFAGKFLTFPDCAGSSKWVFNHSVYLNGSLGGGIRGWYGSSESVAYAMLFQKGCIVDGGVYSFEGGVGHNKDAALFCANPVDGAEEAVFKNLSCTVNHAGTAKSYGLVYCLARKLVVDNVNIVVNGTGEVDTCVLYGLYHNTGVEGCVVKNANVTVRAKNKAPSVFGMYFAKGKSIELTNNTVYVDAADNSVDKKNGGCGYACYFGNRVEKAVINGGEYEGVMTAISVYASLLIINGGTFVSCSHGGFYYSATGGKCYVKNAKIGTCVYSGIFNQSDMGNTNPLGGFYIGGSNNQICVDNCEYLFTDDTQYAGGVLRNGNDGKDSIHASLYISNMTIPEEQKLRADVGNRVYVGAGTNITKANTCTIYGKPIDDATLVYTGYNEYTYENDYTNKRCDAIPSTVSNALKATKSGAVVAVDDISPVAHQVSVSLDIKNVFCFQQATAKTFAGGVTWISTAGTPEFTLNGTATKEDASSLVGAFPMKAGTYKVSTRGLKAVSGNNRIYVKPEGGSIVNNIYDGSPKEITLTEDCNIAVQLIIANGSAYDNTPIRIVIEKAPFVTDETEVTVTAVDSVDNPTVTRSVKTTFAEGTTLQSIAPNMTVYTDNDRVELDVTYNRDINRAFWELSNAIGALSAVPMAICKSEE